MLQVDPVTYGKWESAGRRLPLEAFTALATGAPPAPFSSRALRAARKAAGISQAEAAALVGVRVLAWHAWESGARAMPYWRWVLFCARWQAEAAAVVAVVAEAAYVVPTGADVRAARADAGLTLRQAAALVYSERSLNWAAVEAGTLAIPPAAWELFRLKAARGNCLGGWAAPSVPPAGVIKAARLSAGLTQSQAAGRVHATRVAWAAWESGRNAIPLLSWELFLLKS